MKQRSELFGRLLKAGIGSIAMCEGKKAPIIEEDLGDQIGVSGDTIQRYKAGHVPPESRSIQTLAEACVRRGMMGREWLEQFLTAARYPSPERLSDELRPLGISRPRPQRIYENLPAPTYSQFIMRAEPFTEIADGLAKRSAAVIIVGMGGNGKTSLAREVAARSLRDDAQVPRFDAAVWISDKDRPGTTNLSIILDIIARTLDYPGLAQLPFEEKLREVEQLIRRQRTLIVVDNAETITDDALVSWLLNLPEPSKALITTREYRREYRRGGWPVELRGMTDTEAWALVGERLRVLRMERLVHDVSELAPLVATTGGNPKAIEITLGLAKYERRPLQQIVDDLYSARGDLFDDLFTRAWSLLDEAARRILQVMTFFPESTGEAALQATADVRGFAAARAIERLVDLALLDVQQDRITSPPRYALHPLVRAFAAMQLRAHPAVEVEARERWAHWYHDLGRQVSFEENDLTNLARLDPEQSTLIAVVEWLVARDRMAEMFEMTGHIWYYYYFRGIWDRMLLLLQLRATVARQLGGAMSEAEILGAQIVILCRQAKLEEAVGLLQQLRALFAQESLPPEAQYYQARSEAFYETAQQRYSEAITQWEICLSHIQNPRRYAANQQWFALCLLMAGRHDDAEQTLRSILPVFAANRQQRALAFCHLHLAEIALTHGQLHGVMEHLTISTSFAEQYQDRPCLAAIARARGRYHLLRHELDAAQVALMEAVDLFERLGIRHDLAEARRLLADVHRERSAQGLEGGLHSAELKAHPEPAE